MEKRLRTRRKKEHVESEQSGFAAVLQKVSFQKGKAKYTALYCKQTQVLTQESVSQSKRERMLF